MTDKGNAEHDGKAAAEQSQRIPPSQQSATTPSEREIAEGDNKRAAENRERLIKRPLRRLIHCLDRHNGIITAAATAAIAGLTLSLSIDSSRQAETARNQFGIMQGQLDEAKKQRLLTMAQTRAIIRRTDIVPHPVTTDGTYAEFHQQIVAFDFNPVWKNVGATEARDYYGWWNIFVKPRPAAGSDGKIHIECPSPERPSGKIIATIEPPTQEIVYIAKRVSVDDIMAARGDDFTKLIYLAGHLEYDDIFVPETKRHHFDWCVLMQPNEPAKSLFSFPKLREEAD